MNVDIFIKTAFGQVLMPQRNVTIFLFGISILCRTYVIFLGSFPLLRLLLRQGSFLFLLLLHDLSVMINGLLSSKPNAMWVAKSFQVELLCIVIISKISLNLTLFGQDHAYILSIP